MADMPKACGERYFGRLAKSLAGLRGVAGVVRCRGRHGAEDGRNEACSFFWPPLPEAAFESGRRNEHYGRRSCRQVADGRQGPRGRSTARDAGRELLDRSSRLGKVWSRPRPQIRRSACLAACFPRTHARHLPIHNKTSSAAPSSPSTFHDLLASAVRF